MTKPKEPTESAHQIGFVSWFRAKYPGVLIFHVPNERRCSIATGKRLKAEGVVAGVPDLAVPAWNLYIEMKRPGGKLSPAQKDVIEYLKLIGCNVIVAYGAEDASRKLMKYLLHG